jgi:hypothetical protein
MSAMACVIKCRNNVNNGSQRGQLQCGLLNGWLALEAAAVVMCQCLFIMALKLCVLLQKLLMMKLSFGS